MRTASLYKKKTQRVERVKLAISIGCGRTEHFDVVFRLRVFLDGVCGANAHVRPGASLERTASSGRDGKMRRRRRASHRATTLFGPEGDREKQRQAR